MNDHLSVVRDQFTRQAEPFSNAVHATDPEAMALYVSAIEPHPSDRILDVASGPGLVARALRNAGALVCCVDVTTEMLLKARKAAPGAQVAEADAAFLPFRSNSFDTSVSRLAFHHVRNARQVMGEMKRVTKRGGRIVVNDIVTSENPEESEYTERIERLRDPSHSRMLSTSELVAVCSEGGMGILGVSDYRIPLDHDEWMGRVFPPEENRPIVRRMLVEIAGRDMGGMKVHIDGERLMISREARIVAVRKP